MVYFWSHMSLEFYISTLIISMPVAKTPSAFQVIARHAADANVIFSLQKYNCLHFWLFWKLSNDCLKVLLHVINITVWLEVTNANFTAIGCTVLQCVYTLFRCFSFSASPYVLLEFILMLVISWLQVSNEFFSQIAYVGYN